MELGSEELSSHPTTSGFFLAKNISLKPAFRTPSLFPVKTQLFPISFAHITCKRKLSLGTQHLYEAPNVVESFYYPEAAVATDSRWRAMAVAEGRREVVGEVLLVGVRNPILGRHRHSRWHTRISVVASRRGDGAGGPGSGDLGQRQTCVLEGLVGHLEQDALLGVEDGGLARRELEEGVLSVATAFILD